MNFQLQCKDSCETVGKGVSITRVGTGRNFSASIHYKFSVYLTFATLGLFLLYFQPCQFFYYMKSCLSTSDMFCQIQLQDTLGVPGMLKDYLRSYQTKLEVLSQIAYSVTEQFQVYNTNIYRGFLFVTYKQTQNR